MTDVTPDDIEVGRFAVRTFRLERGIPQSLCSPTLGRGLWQDGVCEAQCLEREFNRLHNPTRVTAWGHSYDDMSRYVHDPYSGYVRHPAPQLDCSCGIYGALYLSYLDYQYPWQSQTMVAVIAAEGRTIIGSQGLRTERARVVAYWHVSQPLSDHFPDALRYDSRFEMAIDYGIDGWWKDDIYDRRMGQNHAWRRGEVEKWVT